MTRPWSIVRLTLLALTMSCVQGDFLEGVSCRDDRECGRKLECSAGFCGGCPEDALLDDGSCGCAGDRILECRGLDPANPCVTICESERELCQVVVVTDQRRELPPCMDAGEGQRCFTVELDAAECTIGQARIVLEPPDPIPEFLVVNCPPPASEESSLQCVDD